MITWSCNSFANDTTSGKIKNQVLKYDTKITLNLNTSIIII